MTHSGHGGVRVIRRAQTLLLSDAGYQNKEIAQVLGVSSETADSPTPTRS
ncbi:helix-turn-helix domain-containing protein [Candidatus Poribacteria bacterium]|nr:helix-turn-helix domain-containing protein [Candidatus Poribacteria bacterium]